jgi:hypothetical protein
MIIKYKSPDQEKYFEKSQTIQGVKKKFVVSTGFKFLGGLKSFFS